MARSEFKRKRHYYTKAQIESGLMTDGKEWMFIDGTEYIGQYHKYTTKETFSEINFVKGKSRKGRKPSSGSGKGRGRKASSGSGKGRGRKSSGSGKGRGRKSSGSGRGNGKSKN